MGRMGAGISRRLMKDGHSAVVYDRDADAVGKVVADGATAAKDLAGLVKASEDEPQRKYDPWELVTEAVQLDLGKPASGH